MFPFERMVHDMMPRQGTMIADRYRLERKVGGGRVSAMWRVQDQVTEGACAVKLLHRSMNDHPEALARFSLEDRLSRELTGAYFPERIGSGSWHSLRYIAWRWYDGDCLRSLFDRTPKQDVQTVYSIVQETCQALTVVHGAGYTHGDLKPENLFFAERAEKDSTRQLKLLGFGVASRLARPLLGAQARRTPGQIVGTPLYLSPDLILGRVPRGGQADLWALSVIVYEALTGRVPFLGTDLAEVLEKILERQAPRPSSVTDNLPGTFDLWWQQALEQQFATPGELASSLARALAPALRSSRTQRSASLPDRMGPVVETVALRALAATPHVPEVGAARTGTRTPAWGMSAGTGVLKGPASSASNSSAESVGAMGSAPASVPHTGRSFLAGKSSATSTADTASLSAASPSAASPSPSAASPSAGSAGSPSAGSPSAAGSPALASRHPASLAASGSQTSSGRSGGSSGSSSSPGSVGATSPGLSALTASSPVARSPVANGSASPRPGHEASAARSATAAAAAAGTATGEAGASAASLGSTTAVGVGKSPEATPLVVAVPTTPGQPETETRVSAGNRSVPADAPGRAKAAPIAETQAQPTAAAPAASTSTPLDPVPRTNVTSTTVAGIGPAALSMMRALEQAAAGATAKIHVAAPQPDRSRPPAASDADKFATLSSPLLDLSLASRKTLVGIVAPSTPMPSPAPSAVALSAIAPVKAPAAKTAASLVIAGTPCRSIDVSAEYEEGEPPSLASLRRPGSPTVPFPRPRAASRGVPRDPTDPAADPGRTTAVSPSWQERTHHTLRIVLTDRDHRPHLVAGFVVCAAAALVIFLAGRSPVSGSGVLDQATRSLSTEPAGTPPAALKPSLAAPPARSPRPEEPSLQALAAQPKVPDSAQGDTIEVLPPAPSADEAKVTALPGVEVAPGLIVPPHAQAESPAGRLHPDKTKPGVNPTPSPLPPTSLPRTEPHPAGAQHPSPPPSGAVPARAAGKKPGDPATPPRPANPDFDFGI
jgi:serine/threonine protein kinase